MVGDDAKTVAVGLEKEIETMFVLTLDGGVGNLGHAGRDSWRKLGQVLGSRNEGGEEDVM